MFLIGYVEDNAYKTIEIIGKEGEAYASIRERANKEYEELCRPGVEELEAYVCTVDVKFSSSSKEYTYFCNRRLPSTYKHIITPEGDILQIVRFKYRTPKELKAMAQSRGFSYSIYKVLHGTAIK